MENCFCDIEAAIEAVKLNYAGYNDKYKRLGPQTIEDAAVHAMSGRQKSKTAEDCHKVINDWLGVFQDGHLSLIAEEGNGKWFSYTWSSKTINYKRPTRSPEPEGKILSENTFLIVIPDFDLQYKARVDELFIKFDDEIKTRENLIIDLRGNGGGSDLSYSALSPYLYTQPYICVGADVLSTKVNVNAWEDILNDIPEQEKEFRSLINNVIQKMRAVPEGTFVSIAADETKTLPEVLTEPSKIGIIFDRMCASATEELLIEARQSKKVTLFGETSAGVLDYANIREYPLPSGTRKLTIPTSRSRRLPDDPVDNVGIIPDIPIENMDEFEAETDRVFDIIREYWRSQ